MKKNVSYYFDEDDAVPIKRRKRSAPDRAASGNGESIRFTPRKNEPTAPVTKASATASASANVGARPVANGTAAKSSAPSTATATAEAPKIQVAEIPYNREYGKASVPAPSETQRQSRPAAQKSRSAAPHTREIKMREDTAPSKTAPKKATFKLVFAVYAAALVVLSLFAIFYVRGLLLDYEAAQPENIVQTKIDEMKAAFKKGKPGSAVSLGEVMEKFSPSEEELSEFMNDFLDSEVTYKKISDSSDPSRLSFDILSDNYKMAHLAIRSEGKVSKLVIFSMDKWVIEEFKVTGFTMDVTLPASLTVKNGDEVIEGVPAEDGRTATYSVSSLTMPSITFTDVLGTTKSYSDSGEYKFTEYLISLPSNYILKGDSPIPLSCAVLEDIDEYRYVYEYCESMPKTANYSICVMSEEANLSVLDNTGAPVDVSALGNSFELTGQKGSDTLPENVAADPDPLDMAKQWSLFMTSDLAGARHGFYNMEKYLIADSYLRDVAWKWATGVDITFTSPHTLAKNPFTTAEATNYVAYSDTCFSCDVLLEKPMYITRANTVIDKIHSTFYFVYCDDTDDGVDNPHWAIADIQKITE